MVKRTILVNAALWVVIAILLYFMVEMFSGWKPLKIPVGDLTIPIRNIIFFMLSIFMPVRLYFLLRK